jgi:large subunit ribosomal protein L25
MEKTVLKAEPRTVIGKQVKALRREGKLPAVLYGQAMVPVLIVLDARETGKIMSNVTASQLVNIDVNGEIHTALVRERQRDKIRGNLTHIDFLVVSMTETLKASVPLVLEGTAPAVEDQTGVLVSNLESLAVESLPGDLPERLAVDISNLSEVGNAIYVRDLEVPSGVTILTDTDEVIVLIAAPAAEEIEEVEEVEEIDEDTEPEVIERGKKDEDEEDEE